MSMDLPAHPRLQSRYYVLDRAYAKLSILDRDNDKGALFEAEQPSLLGWNADAAIFGHAHQCEVMPHGVPCKTKISTRL